MMSITWPQKLPAAEANHCARDHQHGQRKPLHHQEDGREHLRKSLAKASDEGEPHHRAADVQARELRRGHARCSGECADYGPRLHEHRPGRVAREALGSSLKELCGCARVPLQPAMGSFPVVPTDEEKYRILCQPTERANDEPWHHVSACHGEAQVQVVCVQDEQGQWPVGHEGRTQRIAELARDCEGQQGQCEVPRQSKVLQHPRRAAPARGRGRPA
mmetsp:Transcript_11084/g.25192  ORF Transcript_11084/g.25192 Transcript_11084/m.25192 type:complete len:218 (-) Transcript_11084:2-655(-)